MRVGSDLLAPGANFEKGGLPNFVRAGNIFLWGGVRNILVGGSNLLKQNLVSWVKEVEGSGHFFIL